MSRAPGRRPAPRRPLAARPDQYQGKAFAGHARFTRGLAPIFRRRIPQPAVAALQGRPPVPHPIWTGGCLPAAFRPGRPGLNRQLDGRLYLNAEVRRTLIEHPQQLFARSEAPVHKARGNE